MYLAHSSLYTILHIWNMQDGTPSWVLDILHSGQKWRVIRKLPQTTYMLCETFTVYTPLQHLTWRARCCRLGVVDKIFILIYTTLTIGNEPSISGLFKAHDLNHSHDTLPPECAEIFIYHRVRSKYMSSFQTLNISTNNDI